ncbi:ankyrin repeat-containing domain protein [Mycena floridula]|nr:ankyrin repeat-containing domain protein [Mycena floridula]
MHACFSEHLEIAQLLISHANSIPPNFIYKGGLSELRIAVHCNNVDLVRLLIQQPNIQPGLKDRNGRTPLMNARSHKKAKIAKLLLGHSYYTGQSI